MSESKIIFTKDILLKVSTNLKENLDIVEEVYTSITSYIHHIANNTDAVSIFIPNLGTMYMKVHYIHKMIEKFEGKNNIKYELYKKKLDNISNHANDYISSSKFYRKSRHLSRNKMNNFYYNNGMSITEIEEFQNKL